MTNLLYLDDALKRLCQIERECPTTPPANNAVPLAFYTQNTMSFWTNRIIGYRLTTRSQDWRTYRYKFGMTYVKAFLTENTNGNAEAALYLDIPIISDWIGGAVQLQSSQFPGQMNYLDPEGAYIADLTVFLGQMHSGVGQKIIGADFVLDAPITVPIAQRY